MKVIDERFKNYIIVVFIVIMIILLSFILEIN